MTEKIKLLRCGDQNFWAYNTVSREHARYSRHDVRYVKHDEVLQNLEWADVILIHSPDITKFHATELPILAHSKGKKVITQYSGLPTYWSSFENKIYSYSDLVVSISPQLYNYVQPLYENVPTIFLPESIDSSFFTPEQRPINVPIVFGFAGGAHKPIKRAYLLDKLKYPVKIMDNWKELRKKNQPADLTLMRDFYKSIDCLIVTSLSECASRVTMEAMACGCAVISTDVGTARLLVPPECIVPTEPEETCIDAMNLAMEMIQSTAQTYGQRNPEHIDKYFSWAANAQLWDDVISAVYDNQPAIAQSIANAYLDNFRTIWDAQLVDLQNASKTPIIEQILRFLHIAKRNQLTPIFTEVPNGQIMHIITPNMSEWIALFKKYIWIDDNGTWLKGDIGVKLHYGFNQHIIYADLYGEKIKVAGQ